MGDANPAPGQGELLTLMPHWPAEGVETEDELKCVKDLGVDYAQGYLLARPAMPPPQHRRF